MAAAVVAPKPAPQVPHAAAPAPRPTPARQRPVRQPSAIARLEPVPQAIADAIDYVEATGSVPSGHAQPVPRADRDPPAGRPRRDAGARHVRRRPGRAAGDLARDAGDRAARRHRRQRADRRQAVEPAGPACYRSGAGDGGRRYGTVRRRVGAPERRRPGAHDLAGHHPPAHAARPSDHSAARDAHAGSHCACNSGAGDDPSLRRRRAQRRRRPRRTPPPVALGLNNPGTPTPATPPSIVTPTPADAADAAHDRHADPADTPDDRRSDAADAAHDRHSDASDASERLTATRPGRSAGATRRARSRPRRRRSATRRRRSGSTPRRRARASSGRPSRSAPSRNVDLAAQVDLARAARRRARRARPACRALAANGTSGTRQIDPAEARSAFGPVGSAQPSDSATAAPNASAVRISVPTFPGSATRQSASVAGRGSAGRQVVAAVDADTRGGCAAVETSASSAARRSRPRRAARPARRWPPSTRSSPSQTKSPSLSRQRRSCSLRTSFSFSLSREVIKPALLPGYRSQSAPWPARRASRTRSGS